MQLLDTKDREAWLLRMRALIERHGPARFVAAPILEPTDRYFPDLYTPDLRGVRTVARRLLRCAGLGELSVDVHGKNAPDEDKLARTVIVATRVETTHLELKVQAIGRAEEVPLVLAYEIARAFRFLVDRARSEANPYRSRTPHDPAADAIEGEEASLTAFYLGFGLLAVIGAHQYRATGELQGGSRTVTRWVHGAIGSIPSETAAFLLAVQATVRRLDEKAIEALGSHLGPDEQTMFERYLRELDADELCAALALAPREQWPAESTSPIEPLEDDGWEPRIDARGEEPLPNRGRPVFRRRQTIAFTVAKVSGLVGAIAIAVAAILGGEGVGFPTGILVVIAGIAATIYGNRIRTTDVCSDPMCEAKIPDGVETCPRCGGTIRGEIGSGEPHTIAVERLPDVTSFGEVVAEQDDADPAYVEAKIACPHCGWIPDGGAHWVCDCSPGELFDTFATSAHCPTCGKRFEDTLCIRCRSFAPYEFWCPDDVSESSDTESP